MAYFGWLSTNTKMPLVFLSSLVILIGHKKAITKGSHLLGGGKEALLRFYPGKTK